MSQQEEEALRGGSPKHTVTSPKSAGGGGVVAGGGGAAGAEGVVATASGAANDGGGAASECCGAPQSERTGDGFYDNSGSVTWDPILTGGTRFDARAFLLKNREKMSVGSSLFGVHVGRKL